MVNNPSFDDVSTEWIILPFGEILENKKTFNGLYKSKEHHGRGIKIVNMGELFAYDRIGSQPMRHIELSNDELKKYLLRKGDLLFARRSLIASGAGKCSLVTDLSEPTTFESSLILARPNPDIANSEYLFYFFKSPYGRYLMGTILRQVAVAGITGSDLQKLPIPLPSIDIQNEIAEILGSFDNKIETNKLTNQTLEELARTIFQSWFVNFDPVRAKAEGRDTGLPAEIADLFPDGFEESAVGEIPRGWRVGTIGEEFKLTMGQSPPGDTYNVIGIGLPFYQGRSDFGFRYPNRRVFCTKPNRIANENDTLVSVRAPVGDINMASETCALGRGVAALLHITESRSYTYYALKNIQSEFTKFEAEGTVFGSINKNDFLNIRVITPSVDIIAAFEKTCYPFDEMIKNNVLESRTLEIIRDTLLLRLIIGEANVPTTFTLSE